MNSGYGQFAYYYDLLTQNVDYQKRGKFFHRILLDHGKDHGILVDLACGTGSLSEFFARLNYDVIGIDASEAMLEIANEKRMQSGSSIIYLHQTMQELDLFGTVDVVLCTLDSLNHITQLEQLQQVLQRISLFLNPDALFVFDMNTIYKHDFVLANHTFVYDLDEVYCVWQNRLKENHVVEITLDLFEYEEETDAYVRYQEQFLERAYSIEQVKQVLEQTNFELLALYGDDTLQKPTEQTQRIIGVCRNQYCKNRIPEE